MKHPTKRGAMVKNTKCEYDYNGCSIRQLKTIKYKRMKKLIGTIIIFFAILFSSCNGNGERADAYGNFGILCLLLVAIVLAICCSYIDANMKHPKTIFSLIINRTFAK